MATIRTMELDSVKLFEAIETAAQAKRLSLRAACEQAGVSPNTTTRLKAGFKVEADILLALLDWLGVKAVRKFMREVPPLQPQEEHDGYAVVN